MKKSRTLYISMSRSEKIWGWLYMVFSLLALPGILSWVNGQLAAPVAESTLNFVFYLTNFLFICGIFRRFLRASLVAAWRDLWNFIQAVVLGYCGLHLNEQGDIAFTPALPENWQQVRFRIVWRGKKLLVTVRDGQADVQEL